MSRRIRREPVGWVTGVDRHVLKGAGGIFRAPGAESGESTGLVRSDLGLAGVMCMDPLSQVSVRAFQDA